MTDPKKQVILMKGIGVSSGIVIGKTYIIERGKVEPAQFCYLDPSETEREIERFKAALRASRDQLMRIKHRMEQDGKGKEHIRIIDAHLMILKDNMLINDTVKVISEQKVNAEWALKTVLKEVMEYFEKMEDPYLKERAVDIEHLVDRVLLNLMGKKHESVAAINEPVIVVAHDLAPTDTAQMVKGTVLGFLTDVGGKTSHTAIMARSIGIPAVVGVEQISREVNTGDLLVVDGNHGIVVIHPDKKTIEEFTREEKRFIEFTSDLDKFRNLPAETPDGHRIELAANIEFPDEIPSVLAHGARGIGLYRTEYFYLNRTDLPLEEEQYEAYRTVAERMKPYPVIIRSLDLGGDKFLSSLEVPHEMNPFLGWRAIRFCLARVDIFKAQLRAVLRASVHGNLKLMYPMISNLTELQSANRLLGECRKELKKKKIPFDPKMAVGAMIEIPSAALTSDSLAKEVERTMRSSG